jgi:DNA processing protein
MKRTEPVLDGDRLTAWIALSLIPGMSLRRLRALISHAQGDPRAVFELAAAALRAVPGVGERTAAAIRAVDLGALAERAAGWRARGVEIVTVDHPLYPDPLRRRDGAPPTLFVRGSLENCVGGLFSVVEGVALVGTRTPSQAGLSAARRLAGEAVRRGWTVISGLAVGIDTAAHTGALDAGGRTLAVLGCGVLAVYPPQNQGLAARIAARGGALISEIAPDAPVERAALVARNRIIALLSRQVIVVESQLDGGAMHAARFAQSAGIPVRFGHDSALDALPD